MLLAAWFLVSILTGYLVTKLLLPPFHPRWAGEILSVSLGAGLGAGVTSCLYFLVCLLIGPSTPASVSAQLVLMGAAGARCWLTRAETISGESDAQPRAFGWLLPLALVAALAIAVTLFVNAAASNSYGGWDALAIWNLRAEFLAQDAPLWKNAFSPLLNRTQPGYPLLLSGFIASCWRLTGSAGDVAAPIWTAAVFSFATLGTLVAALAILRGWSAAMLGGLILLGTATFLQNSFFQYADVPLGFYYLAAFASVFLTTNAIPSRGQPIVLTGLALACAAWTKNEGLLFAAVAGIGFGAYFLASRKTEAGRMLLLLASGAAIPLAITLHFRLFLAPSTGDFASLTWAAAARKVIDFPRYVPILNACWRETVSLGTGIAHPVISIAVLAGCMGISTRRREPMVITSLAVWLAVAAGYFFAYVVTPVDLAWQLGTALGRLYLHLWPSLIFLTLIVLRTPEEAAMPLQPAQKSDRLRTRKGKKARAG